jgi:hypothetical protein
MHCRAMLRLKRKGTMTPIIKALQSNAYNNSYLLTPTSYLKGGEPC